MNGDHITQVAILGITFMVIAAITDGSMRSRPVRCGTGSHQARPHHVARLRRIPHWRRRLAAAVAPRMNAGCVR